MNGQTVPPRRFRALRADRRLNLWALVDGDNEPLAVCGAQRARRLARFLNEWSPSEQELAAFLSWSSPDADAYVQGEFVRISLQFSAICVRCGQRIPKGARASWDPNTKLVVHGARCPLVVEAKAA